MTSLFSDTLRSRRTFNAVGCCKIETGMDSIGNDEGEPTTSSKNALVQANSRQHKFDDLKLRLKSIRDKSEKREQKVLNKKMRQAARLESKIHDCPNDSVRENEAKWKDVTKYLDINSHLVGAVSHGSSQAKSGLEEKINTAIKSSDIETAEVLSDQLAQRDMGVRLADAFAAKKYDEEKKRIELLKKSRKKKKPSSGCKVKERWEMKGNM